MARLGASFTTSGRPGDSTEAYVGVINTQAMIV